HLRSREVIENTSPDGFESRPENSSKATNASLTSGAATNTVALANPAITNSESLTAGSASVEPLPEPAAGKDAGAAGDTAAGTASATSQTGADGSTAPAVHRRRFRKTEPADSLEFPDETTEVGQLEYLLRYGALPPSAAAKG